MNASVAFTSFLHVCVEHGLVEDHLDGVQLGQERLVSHICLLCGTAPESRVVQTNCLCFTSKSFNKTFLARLSLLQVPGQDHHEALPRDRAHQDPGVRGGAPLVVLYNHIFHCGDIAPDHM